MTALNEQQRNFIKAMLANPWGTGADWARAAGYSDAGESGKTTAYRLNHSPKIMAAAREYAAGHFLDGTGVTMAIAVLISELTNKDAKVRLAAANSILDRGGVSAKTEHRVTVSHSVEDMEKIAHRLAVELGVEPMKLIGGNNTIQDIPATTTTKINSVSKTGGDAGHTPMRAGRHDNAPVFDTVDGTRAPIEPHGLSPKDIEKAERGPQPRPPEPSEGAAERVRQQMDIDSDIAF